jgi:hypothetical protein
MRAPRIGLAVAVLLLATGPARPGEEPPDPEAFLRAWVRGHAEYRIGSAFHEAFPRSPHKRDSERFEAAWRCFQTRELLDATRRSALARDLRKRLADETTPLEERARLVFVLARLQDREAVPAIGRLALEGRLEEREEAVEGLAFFGNRPAWDSFLVFGGRIRWILFPARPQPAASTALIAFLGQSLPKLPRPEPPPGGEPVEKRRRRIEAWFEARSAWKGLRSTAIRSLESHATPEVEELALSLREAPYWTDELLAALDTPRTVGRLVERARRGDVSAVRALGGTSRKEALSALIDLLADRSREVREEADASVAEIVDGRRHPGPGERPAREWRRRLGEELERFDEEGVRRRRTALRPGLHGL